MAVQEQAVPQMKTRAVTVEPRQPFSWGRVGRYVAVVLVVFLSLAPLYWTVATSLKNEGELNISPPTLVPQSITWANYATVLSLPIFARALLNSAIISIITTLIGLAFGAICAYAISRMKFKGKPIVLGAILSVQMFPFIAMVGPLFVLFTNIGLYNTYAALIIPDLLYSLPITVWFLVSFFNDLPPDLEEAARVDGASRLRALWEVIIPLTAPGVFSAAILSFIAVWNDFIFGLTLTADQNAQPVTVAITRFNGEHNIPWGEIAAASVIVTIPLVIMVLILQRRIVSGLTAGAVKG